MCVCVCVCVCLQICTKMITDDGGSYLQMGRQIWKKIFFEGDVKNKTDKKFKDKTILYFQNTL